jgi:phospholipase C
MPMEDIQHIVVLMLENRSFDHMLGDLSLNGRTDVDGLAPGMSNPDPFGGTAEIQAVTTERFLTDAGHAFLDVKQQLDGVGGQPNQGFVINYATRFPTEAKQRKLAPEIMHYQTADTVPVHHWLADEYAISDRWFCSVPSETWPNRIFAAAATTNGRVKNGLPLYNLPTIFSRLRDKGLEWACYNDQLPLLTTIIPLAGEYIRSRHRPKSRFRSMQQFEEDCDAGTLREYSFIEPIYLWDAANDDHPPHDIEKGQLLAAQVYLAIRRNEELWKKTVLIITPDEHGGFFDHVPPAEGAFIPAPALPPGTTPPFGFDFHRLGPRVPLILVSPWASKRSVFRPAANEFFDHTSLIRSAAVRWDLEPLTARDEGARDFWAALDLAEPRTDDTDTFDAIDIWYRKTRPKTLSADAMEENELVGMDGRSVASLIAREGQARTLAIEDEVPSELQLSVQELAAEIDARADELEATAVVEAEA